MRGTVESVRKDLAGSVLRSGVSPSDTTLDVVDVSDFTDDDQPHQVKVGGTSLVYDSVTEDATGLGGVLNLTAAAGITKAAGTTRVDVPGSVTYKAMVRPIGGRVSAEATIVHHLIDKAPLTVTPASDGALVECEKDPDGKWTLTRILDREPIIDLAFAMEGTAGPGVLDLSTPALIAEWSALVAGLGGGGGGDAHIGGGHWGDGYSSFSVGGGSW